MVDEAVRAAKIAAGTDAVARIRELLPANAGEFARDRTAREVVAFNLLIAVQECLSLAAHLLADSGWSVPSTYAAVFGALSDHGVIADGLAHRLAAAAGLRNLIAHQYGAVDADRLFWVAANGLDDLLQFCSVIARRE